MGVFHDTFTEIKKKNITVKAKDIELEIFLEMKVSKMYCILYPLQQTSYCIHQLVIHVLSTR